MREPTLATIAVTLAVACSSPTEVPVDTSPVGPELALHPLRSRQLCKLLSARDVSDPTVNDVQHRANVLGADLGIAVVHADTLFLLFGDTIGYAGIWKPGESHPDAVGYGVDPAADIRARPELLCNGLRIVSLPPADSLGPKLDPTVIADFAAASMTPPPDHEIGEFIHNPAGGSPSQFAQLPGDFEVPSGAFATADGIYIFYTTVASPTDITMKASYLARWSQPAPGGRPEYQILYGVDERFDAAGPLHGDFINIAAEVAGDHVYVFGTGDYRRSGIEVARKRLDQLAEPGGFDVIGRVTETPGYGEVSVRYLPAIDRWLLVAEELTPISNRIVAYLAADPAGPWSGPMTLLDMADPAFRATYCCTGGTCREPQMFDCDRTGFYGAYLLPDSTGGGTELTVAYTLSSFSPYNVALFETTFAIERE